MSLTVDLSGDLAEALPQPEARLDFTLLAAEDADFPRAAVRLGIFRVAPGATVDGLVRVIAVSLHLQLPQAPMGCRVRGIITPRNWQNNPVPTGEIGQRSVAIKSLYVSRRRISFTLPPSTKTSAGLGREL